MKRFRDAFVVAALGLALQPAWAQQAAQMPRGLEKSPQAPYRGISLTFDRDRVFYLSPDDRVDVIAVVEKTPESAAAGNEDGATTLLKHVRVLAVRPSETSPGKSVVHLAVAPLEAQYLEVAAHQGSLWLSLRKKGDVEDHPLEMATWRKALKSEFHALLSPRVRQRQEEEIAAPCNRVIAEGGSAGASILADVESRMRESYPALSVSIASDKVLFVQPGDRIDVLATIDARRPKSSKTIGVTQTLLQNILVLDNRKLEFLPGRNILLIAMNYDEVQYAALAWDTAEIQILSRDKADRDTYPIQPATLDKLQ